MRVSGYRYYDVAQLEDARLIAMLRQLEFSLAEIRELVACDPADAAEPDCAALARKPSPLHDARRDLADYVVNKLRGKRSVMYEVATREIPERSVLCLKRSVDEQGAWALGKEFIAILRERPLPKMEGREGAMFSIYWGEVSADSDGPVEWCKPVPEAEAQELAPKLSRVELAERTCTSRGVRGDTERHDANRPGRRPGRAVATRVARPCVPGRPRAVSTRKTLTLQPEDLGIRITYFASEPMTRRQRPVLRLRRPVRPCQRVGREYTRSSPRIRTVLDSLSPRKRA